MAHSSPLRVLDHTAEQHDGLGVQAVELVGGAERWQVPVGSWTAPTGFDLTSRAVNYLRHTLVVPFGQPSVLRVTAGGKEIERLGNPNTSIAIQPAHVEHRFVAPLSIRFAHLYFDHGWLRLLAIELFGRAGDRDGFFDLASLFREDRSLRDAAVSYLRLALRADRPGPMEMDAHATLVATRLLRRWSVCAQPGLQTGFDVGGLAAWQVRRLREHIEDRLEEDVRLLDLAAAVKLSPRRLTTLFGAHFGEPPHQYLMRRRIERACEMLVEPGRPVTDIALACGFASSQHLATAFRRRVGQTPTEYRRDRLR